MIQIQCNDEVEVVYEDEEDEVGVEQVEEVDVLIDLLRGMMIVLGDLLLLLWIKTKPNAVLQKQQQKQQHEIHSSISKEDMGDRRIIIVMVMMMMIQVQMQMQMQIVYMYRLLLVLNE